MCRTDPGNFDEGDDGDWDDDGELDNAHYEARRRELVAAFIEAVRAAAAEGNDQLL
jgi:hypothetical protein